LSGIGESPEHQAKYKSRKRSSQHKFSLGGILYFPGGCIAVALSASTAQ
jgi:hypothetical protein